MFQIIENSNALIINELRLRDSQNLVLDDFEPMNDHILIEAAKISLPVKCIWECKCQTL